VAAPWMDPSAAFAELARIDLNTTGLPAVLLRVAELARASIPAADEVSLSLVRGGRATTPAFTGPLALACDEGQYTAGRGPCLDAAESGTTLVANDLAAEDRWPGYAQHAVEQGAAASLSVPLPVQDGVTGALNLYSRTAGVFDAEAVTVARTFASYGAVAVANAHLYAMTAAFARDMQDAMASRAVIEQAKGVVMGQRGCGEQEAFDVISRASQRTNRKLRDLAAEIVRTAEKGPARPVAPARRPA
jgi:GAF domain-containing protein